MSEKSKLTEPTAVIIAAIIGAVVAIGIAYFQIFPPTPKKEQCSKIKERAEEYAKSLNDKVAKAKNDRELFNLIFWRDEFDKISAYDCVEVNARFEKIMKSFEKAAKQLNL